MEKQLTRRNFLYRCGRNALICTGSAMFPGSILSRSAQATVLKKGLIGKKLSPYFSRLGNDMIRCELCPLMCEVGPGERGLCEVRENIDGQFYSLVYANPCAVHIDPIEKEPLYHVLPTSRAFSIATAGCNLDCKFCQYWEISQARPDDTFNYHLPPERVISSALRYKSKAIASTYVEPVIFIEYMLEIGRLAKSKPLLKIMHSNGFINRKPLGDLCEVLDAACIDLKGFTEDYYQNVTEGSLEPVLNTLKVLKTRKIHIEIVNLVVPGKNDATNTTQDMCRWIRQELGPDIPVHFIRFYPRYKLKSIPPTRVHTLEKAREIAVKEGLHHVYIGNVPDHSAAHTYCPHCKKVLIHRIGYQVKVLALTGGKCKYCGRNIYGIWK